MRRYLTFLLLLLATPVFAQANRIPFNGASAFSLNPGNASCDVTVRSTGTAGESQYVTRDCDGTTTEGFVWFVRWNPGLPTSGTISVDVDAQIGTGGSNANVCLEVSHGCSAIVGAGQAADMTWGAATKQAFAGTTLVYKTHTIASVPLSADVAIDHWCAIKVRRQKDGSCSDVPTVDLWIRGGAVRF